MIHHWFVFFAAVNGLLVTLLAINVSINRIKHKVGNGDGGKLPVKSAIRAHGNAVEHTTIYAIIILALSFMNTPGSLQAVLVIGFSLSRLAHAVSMLTAKFNLRRLAAGGTYLFELLGCISLVMLLVTKMTA